MTRIVPLILAGGQGTRLWPMSRSARPKQFLPLVGALSLYQETIRRTADPERYEAPVIVTNVEYRFLVAEQAQELGIVPAAILLEPVARNTAAAIAAAAVYVRSRFGDDPAPPTQNNPHAQIDGPFPRWQQGVTLLDALQVAGRAHAQSTRTGSSTHPFLNTPPPPGLLTFYKLPPPPPRTHIDQASSRWQQGVTLLDVLQVSGSADTKGTSTRSSSICGLDSTREVGRQHAAHQSVARDAAQLGPVRGKGSTLQQ
jgi:hypothetical protein